MSNSHSHLFRSVVVWSVLCLLFSCYSALGGGVPVPQEHSVRTPVFVANKGQWSAPAAFCLSTRAVDVWCNSTSILYDYRNNIVSHREGTRTIYKASGQVVRMEFEGALRAPALHGEQAVEALSHYFLGRDTTKWQRDVQSFREVWYTDMYPRVDVRLYTDGAWPRYDVLVRPGGSPRDVVLAFSGMESVQVGELSVTLDAAGSSVVQGGLYAYQIIDGVEHPVQCRFVDMGHGRVGFEVGSYNPAHTLVLDPLVYSTFVGSTLGDEAFGIARDAKNNTYIVGTTFSLNYPTTTGAYDTTKQLGADIFVSKLSPAANDLLYSTFIGGDGDDYGYDIAVNALEEVAITGYSFSSDFPMTAQTWDRTLGGDRDIVVVKLNNSGNSLLGSTYLGGSSWDEGYAIALDGSGNMYVTGMSTSIDFPTVNAYDDSQNGAQDVVVAKLNSRATNLLYGSFLGGTSSDQGNAIAVDGNGAIYVGGSTGSSGFPTVTGSFDQSFNGNSGTLDGFIAKLSGSSLVYSTFLGGTGNDEIRGLALDNQNNAYVGGQTSSPTPSFPITSGAYDNALNGIDAFLARLNASGSSLMACTYIGQDNLDVITDIAVDASGYVYATGYTQSSSFPTTAGAFDGSYNGGDRDAFVIKCASSLTATSLLYGTYIGGNNYDEGKSIAVDDDGSAYIAGITRSGNFPTTLGVYSEDFGGLSDAYVAKVGTATPTLGLSKPEGGEEWCTGSKQNILWSSRSVTYVRIELSTNAGVLYSIVLADTVAAAHNAWSWNIPKSFPAGTQYRIRVVNIADNTLLSASKNNFAIHAAPAIATQPRDVVACIGEDAVFQVVATAFPAATIQWEVSSDHGTTWQSVPEPIGGQNPLVVSNVQLSQHDYLYRVVLVNRCDKTGTVSSTATLSVRSQPKVLSAPQNIVLCAGGEGTLSVAVDEPGVRYQWRRNGQPITGANARQLTLRNAQAATAGQYDVVVTGACPPNVISTAATVSVQLPLDVAKAPVFRNILCPGETRDTTVLLANNGPLDVAVSLVSITNPRFSLISPSDNFTIAAGQTQTLTVRFTPQSARIETGEMVFSTQPCNNEIRVPLGARADSLRIAAADAVLPPLFQCHKERTTVVRVVNTGSIAMPIVRVQFSRKEFSLISPKLPFAIQPDGKWVDAVVQFTDEGSSDNPIQTTVSFVSDTCAGGVQAQATLTLPRGFVDFSPSQSQVDFGALSFCDAYNEGVFRVFNKGVSVLRIDSIALDNAAFGVVDPASAFDIRANDSREITVRFTGGSAGVTTGTLTLFESTCRTSRSVKLRGQRTEASLAASAVSVDMGSYLPCVAVRDTTIELTNYDAETVTIERVDIDAPFVVVSPSFPLAIRAGEKQPLTLRFVPASDGAFTGQALLRYTTPTCSSSVAVALAASRLTPTFSLTPKALASITLGDCQAFADTILVLHNTGNVPLTLQRATGAPSVQVLSTMPRTLALGATDTIAIRIQPVLSNISENLQLHFAQCDSVLAVPISAHKQGVVYSLTTKDNSDTLWFDDVTSCSPQQQTKQLLIRIARENSTTIESTVSLVSLQPSSPFAVSLVAGTPLQEREREFDVVFSPLLEGEFTATLTVAFMPCGTTRTVVLRGRRVRAEVVASLTDIDFGIVQQGGTRTRRVVLRNTGTTTTTISGIDVPMPFEVQTSIPPLPAHIAPSDSLVLQLLYTAGKGKQTATMLVRIAQPCADSLVLTVRGEGKDIPTTVLATVPAVDFGDVLITTQSVRTVVVKNMGAAEAVVNTTPALSGADATAFGVQQQPAATIPIGDSTTVSLAFAPRTLGVKRATCTIEYNGAPLHIDLVGRGVGETGAQSVVELPDTTATPFTRGLRLPLTVIPGENFSFAVVDSFTAVVRFNSSLFALHTVENARILRDTSVSTPEKTERVLTVRGRHANKPELCAFVGDVLLGDALSTPLALDFSWDKAAGSVQSRDGSLALIGVDSTRLVYSKGMPGILSVVPNPSSTEAVAIVQTIEEGEHSVELFDATGKKVWGTSLLHLATQYGRHGARHAVVLPSSSFASGAYTLRFHTPGGFTHSRSVVILH